MSSDEKRLELNITGRVQGVGFRHFTVKSAKSIGGITGWVRNEPDGSVRLIAEGKPENLEKLLRKVQQGPRMARVDDVELEWKKSADEFNAFDVRYS